MCFSLEWIETLLIWLVIVVAIVAILKLLVPWIFAQIGGNPTGPLMAIVNIFIWAVIAIFVIYIVFALISCLLGMGGGFSLFPRHG
jgi:hypothetical protein